MIILRCRIIYLMAVTHISEAAAALDFAGLMARVRAGEEIVIESGATPVAVLRPAGHAMDSSIAATMARLEAREKSTGVSLRLGAAFADDLEEIVNHRKPRDPSEWD